MAVSGAPAAASVSVVVPCFNAAPYVGATLASALAQDIDGLEVIVVDDASADGSARIVEAVADARVRLLRQPRNMGSGAARNAGLAAARGRFIQFLDADDLLAPGKVRAQLDRLLAPGHDDCVATGAHFHFAETPADGRRVSIAMDRDLDPIDWLVASWAGGGSMHSAGWLVPAHIARAAGPWMERLCPNDDGEYFTRAVLLSRRVLYCGAAASYYRKTLRPSLSNDASRAAMEGLLESLVLGARRLLEREDSPRTRNAAAVPLRVFSHANYPRFRDLVEQSEAVIGGLAEPRCAYQGSRPAAALARVAGWRAACHLDRALRALRRVARPQGKAA